jgi:nitrite reductase/ring-hydroxylating ferredoxin subunit
MTMWAVLPYQTVCGRQQEITVRIAISEFPQNGTRVIEQDGKRILLCRSQKGVFALNEMCPHQNLSLESGRVRGDFIMCPHHGARFSLEDGRSLSPLTPNGLSLYSLTVEGDEVEIDC